MDVKPIRFFDRAIDIRGIVEEGEGQGKSMGRGRGKVRGGTGVKSGV